ncbi:Serine/threonine-protein kinase TOUSLED [Hondaea fermentalgiana]|uniref:Serine/threonine-protein kinase TOUSLED n=1 Tax=Hondaea fermentalgiana TaxID=2315210 RepID=A0A2R5GSJ4_9STRA|nr:Serine/threonine-protein kinase TOUSLED [Hondaea fermentalgiana]|eukprot:GBG33279.1 Serine/threonine-protein kinase TOUSLED [Hondaea fermentalgiana]
MVNELVTLHGADNERLQRLEARIRSHERGGNAVTSVGFASAATSANSPQPAGTAADSDDKNEASSRHEHGTESHASFDSSVSRTIPGIEKVSAAPGGGLGALPPSPEEYADRQQDQQQQRKRKFSPAHTPERRANDVNDGDDESQSEAVQRTPQSAVRQRRRRSELSPANSVDGHHEDAENKSLSDTGKLRSRTPGTAARAAVASTPSSTSAIKRTPSRDLRRPLQDSAISSSVNAHDLLMRHNSKSQGDIVSFASIDQSNASSRGGELTNGGVSRTSGKFNSPGPSGVGANTSSSGAGSKSALRKALKNQPQIKQFFSARTTSASGATPAAFGDAATDGTAPASTGKETPSRRASEPASDNGDASTRSTAPFTPLRRGNSTADGGVAGSAKRNATFTGGKTNDGSKMESATGTSTNNNSSSNSSATPGPGNDATPSVEVARLRRALASRDEELSRLRNINEVKQEETRALEDELGRVRDNMNEYQIKVAKSLEELLRKTDQDRLRKLRQKIVEDGFRLGRLTVQRHGFGPRAKLSETWEEGEHFRDIRARQLDVLQRRDDLEKRKKIVAKQVRQRRANADPGANTCLIDLEAIELEESIKVELANLKRIEQELVEERARVDLEKLVYLQSLRRLRDEDASRFNRQPVLHNRYLLRELLGKGGFSEVWKAFDLVELRDVAVKVHELNSSWNDIKKASYLKHATREYKIHLSLRHPRIVRFYDVFEIDQNSFATVLEFCEGTDLEFHLKHRKKLPEREARSILLQILAGLRYLSSGGELSVANEAASQQQHQTHHHHLNEHDDGCGSNDGGEWKRSTPGPNLGTIDEHDHMLGAASPHPGFAGQERARRPCIIHYDLKPGNILFDGNGGVKITDFGLSKIMEPTDTENTGIELTSQGAGTYWYLPPECFRLSGPPPKISSKVDVWSTGVIFYQMLYGVRPFGEGMTQENVLQQGTITRAFQVSFPEKPQVSNEAKDFIRRCLTYSQNYRPDVALLCEDAYLRQKRV